MINYDKIKDVLTNYISKRMNDDKLNTIINNVNDNNVNVDVGVDNIVIYTEFWNSFYNVIENIYYKYYEKKNQKNTCVYDDNLQNVLKKFMTMTQNYSDYINKLYIDDLKMMTILKTYMNTYIDVIILIFIYTKSLYYYDLLLTNIRRWDRITGDYINNINSNNKLISSRHIFGFLKFMSNHISKKKIR